MTDLRTELEGLIAEWRTRVPSDSPATSRVLMREWCADKLEALIRTHGRALAGMVADAERAVYWKQRAKAAEGHLCASDLGEAAKALHRVSKLQETRWDDLTDQQRWSFDYAALQVIAAVNDRRDARKPNAQHTARDGGGEGSSGND